MKITAYGILIIIVLIIFLSMMQETVPLLQLSPQQKLNILVLGDYGYEQLAGQMAVATRMNEIGEQNNSNFVIGTGDNFYSPDGVTSVDDPNWDTHWSNIYQHKSYLQDLIWFGTIGNHDFNSPNMTAFFQYRKYHWQIDDFFYIHSHKVGDKKIAFVHLDTNYLNYGPEGEPSKPNIFGFNSTIQFLDKTEQMLQQVQDHDVIITVSHHQLGVSCIAEQQSYTPFLKKLLKQYRVTAHLHGHAHNLGYGIQDGIGYFLSGAGGQNLPACLGDPGVGVQWLLGGVYGFLNIDIDSNSINSTFHYVDDSLQNWKQFQAQQLKVRL